MIKSLKRNDIRYTPFVANKSWNSQNQRFEDLISWQSGSESGSLFLTFFDYGDGTQMSAVSSAFSAAIAYQQQDADFLKFRIGKEITGSTFYPLGNQYYNPETNPVNIDESYQSLVYNNAKNFYYKESENPTQIFGLESLDPSNVNRTLPKQISVFNVPVNKFGEKIQPKSIKITHDLPIGYTTVIDDGNNNLKISGSAFSSIQKADYNCVSASIIHGNLTQVYNSTQRNVSVSTIPSNLTVTTTYNGSSSPPINVGKYTVFSEISDGYYCGTKTDNFEITKISATVTVTNVNNSYDGNRHDVTVATTPSGLNYSIVYTKNGIISDPTEVGVYTAVVTIQDQNYMGTGTGTSTITVPISTISFNTINDITYGSTWEIIPVAKDTTSNGFPIKFEVSVGGNLANITGTPENQKISLNPSKTATSLGTVTITATTIPNILGATPISTTKTFTINKKKINLNGFVSAVNRQYINGNTTVNINNNLSNKLILGVIEDDINDITITSPSTGTIADDKKGTNKPVTLASYTLSGTKSAKYELIQPSVNVEIFEKVITLIGDNRGYDGYPFFLKDLAFPNDISNNFKVDWYDSNNNNIATETYINGIRIDNQSSGNFPTNVGHYKLKITDNINGWGATSNQTFTFVINQCGIIRVDLSNGDKFYSQNKFEFIYDDSVKSFSEEIVSPIVSTISFRDRLSKYITTDIFNNLIQFSFISGSPATEYNLSTTKPTVTGNYTLKTTVIGNNFVYNNNNPNWSVGDFIYVIVKNVNKTSAEPDVVDSTITSSTYNLRKYFDPSVLGTWSTVAGSNANKIKTGITNYFKGNNINYLGINLTGAGGGSLQFNNNQSTDKNIEITYYNDLIGGNIISKEYSSAPRNSTDLNFQGDNFKATSIIQRGTFFVPNDNYTIKFKLSNIRNADVNLKIDGGDVIDAAVYDDNLKRPPGPPRPDIRNLEQTYTLSYGYHKFELVFGRQPSLSTYNFSIDYLSQTLGITWVTSISPNVGGGSGASIGFTLPSQYIIDNDLQNVRFIVGKSGKGNIPDPVRKKLVFSFKVTNTTGTLKPMTLTLAGNQYTIDDLSLIVPGSIEVNNGGTEKSDINVITTTNNANFDQNYATILQIPTVSDATCKIKFIFGQAFNNIVTIFQTINTSIDNGGNTYMITGSYTTPKYSFLGMIAGGGEAIYIDNTGKPVYDNNGTASINNVSYEGQLLRTSTNSNDKALTSIFENIHTKYYSIYPSNPFTGEYAYYNTFYGNYGQNILSGFNESKNGNKGTNTSNNPVGGSSVDLSVPNTFTKKYGTGGGGNNPNGTRGNYVITGSKLLSKIYLNGSSIYDVDTI